MAQTAVTVLGLGAMGRALAAAFLNAGHPTTVWNRTQGKDNELVAAGAQRAATVADAVRAGDLLVTCLFDHTSVHDVLDPVATELAGRTVVNLTSTTPDQARALAAWAAAHGADYLDGGIMASPGMIGRQGSTVLYSGAEHVFDTHRTTLALLGAAEYFGDDAGHASAVDFGLLASMYVMFAGYYHGAAMVRSVGMSAEDFGHRAAAWLTAMTRSMPYLGADIDKGDYTNPIQDLNFTKAGVDAVVETSRDAGVDLDVIGAVRNLIDRQVAAGHGTDSAARMFESLNPPARPV
ncbi:NAD(P)-dependent oxidoreductase [Nocardia sp. NPDC052566]|uniref:NAD(P)-dependent oxidoreductase n=1 Tax=Nocardia sp. NPDC052566 TaxID=3364330 RepID=UPI0037C9BDAB